MRELGMSEDDRSIYVPTSIELLDIAYVQVARQHLIQRLASR